MVKIECLACRKTLKIPEYIDTDNYEGQIVCTECESLLYVKLVKSKVRKYRKLIDEKPVEIKFIPAVPRPDYPKVQKKK